MSSRPEFYYSESRKQYRKRVTIDGQVHDLWADTKAELRLRVETLISNQKKGMVLNDSTTVAEYAIEWYPLVSNGLTPSGKKDYANAINVHICPFLGNMKLKDVKPVHIDKLMLAKKDLSKSMQQKILRTLRKMFSSAEENGLIAKNPCNNKKAGGAPAKEKKPLTPQQQLTLLNAVRDTRVYPFVALALYAGLRREEILGLAWSDVHLSSAAPYLEVTHCVRFEKMRPIRSNILKSKAAHRKIPIPQVLAEVLADAKKGASSIYVVPDRNGNLCSLTAYRNLWRLVERRTIDHGNLIPLEAPQGPPAASKPNRHPRCTPSIDFDVTPHVLRHTYITQLCASGLDIKKIQYLAGHSSVAVTLDIYSHVVNNRPEDLYQTIARVFEKSSGSGSGSGSGSESEREAN